MELIYNELMIPGIDWLKKIELRKKISDFRFKKIKFNFDGELIKNFFQPGEGNLSWKRVFKIAGKNLIKGRSRMMVTMGGVAVGVGAIVLLVSFGYGLQSLVTKRIIWPEALKVADVSSESSGVKIDKESLESIAEISNVSRVEPAIRLAGNISFSGSKIDTVVVAARSAYIEMANMKLLSGKVNKKVFDQKYEGETGALEKIIEEREGGGMVAGVSTDNLVIKEGDEVSKKEINFKIKDGTYTTIYSEPKLTAEVAGFAKGSILNRLKGMMIWGGRYEDAGAQGKATTINGQIMGKWIKAKFKVWTKLDDGLYTEKGQETEGFINLEAVQILSDDEASVEDFLEQEGLVLGESTASASTTPGENLADLLSASSTRTGTETASLINILNEEKKSELKPESEVLKVLAGGEKELLISSSLLRAWNKKEDEVIGKTVELQYLVSGELLERAIGRITSEVRSYKIIGVFDDKTKPMVYVPLSDVESMGVKRYSAAKILVKNESDLPQVRALIQTKGLVTRSVADTLGQINRLFAIVRFLLGAFGSIALVVALFGMFNTMTVSLLERTREIGVMKSLGTSNLDVVRIFLTEAGLISTIGSIGGVILGLLLGKIIDQLVFRYSSDNGLFVLPVVFALGVVVVAVTVGVITGLYPSRRASKISAMDALRYE